jgi:hypothetical protein
MKNSEQEAGRSLREIEVEVLAEGQEWMRQRLQQKLPQEADQHGRVFPPERPAALARQSPTDAPAHQRRHRGTARPARH